VKFHMASTCRSRNMMKLLSISLFRIWVNGKGLPLEKHIPKTRLIPVLQRPDARDLLIGLKSASCIKPGWRET
jgi:hypothetical protein